MRHATQEDLDHVETLLVELRNLMQLSNLAIFSLAVLAPEAVEAAKENLSTAETVVGTGAFVLQTSETNVGSNLSRSSSYNSM